MRDDLPPSPDPGEPSSNNTPIIFGVLLFIIGCTLVTLGTFEFDAVKNWVFQPRQYPWVAAAGYICAVGGLLMALVQFIREG